MNKAQLIDRLSGQLGSKKAATDAVEAVVDTITRAVASGEKVAITGFGAFERVARPARTGRNPRTGEAVKIKKTTVPKFKPGQGFKDVVSGAKKLPRAAVAVAKSATGSTPAKKTTAKKTTAKKTAAKKTATKSAAGRTLATKSPAKSAATKKAAAKKLATKKTTAKKTTARR
ncbi:MAG: DNA-binding protein HU-beta [Actinomycetota bacterium]|nr:DNA-binding protein HU-beta [Actinomycetota bacterium]